MAGLYKTALGNPGMTEDQTNGHWKNEQDNYLSQIGAMDLIKRDPMASLGYQIRSANPDQTLEMGANVDPTKYYGIYRFARDSNDTQGRRYDGTVDVGVGLNPMHYGQVLAHELGHVGSRNSQRDSEVVANQGKDEEKRQRLVDYVNNAPGSKMRMDAVWMLTSQFGLKDLASIEREANKVRVQMGLKPVKVPSRKDKVTSSQATK